MTLISDLRNSQILVLIILFINSMFISLNHLPILKSFIVISSAIFFQYFFERITFKRVRSCWWKSGLISSLSIVLLLRFGHFSFYFLATFVAIASKFLLRDRDGNHFLNPTNFAISFMLILFSTNTWIDYGYWGRANVMTLLPLLLAPLVLRDLKVFQTSFIFLILYIFAFGMRHYWLGDPWNIFYHQISNASLFIFAFFMISDPKTSPQSLMGQVIFCSLVVVLTLIWEGFLYKRNGLFLFLTLLCFFNPIFNKFLPGELYQWRAKHVY
jgi:hypothetical protein